MIQAFIKKGFLLQEDFLEIVGEVEGLEPEFLSIISKLNLKNKILNKQIIIENLDTIALVLKNLQPDFDDKKKSKSEKFLNFLSVLRKRALQEGREKKKPVEKSEEAIRGVPEHANTRIVKDYDPPVKKIGVKDFVRHFRLRYSVLRKFLLMKNLENLASINKIGQRKGNYTIIAMIFSKRTTKNNNLMLDVEDLTGRIRVLVNSNRDCFKTAKGLVEDEVVAITCSGNNEILFVNNIIKPDIFVERKALDEEQYAVFTSDIHAGSSKFLEKNFMKFINWINGEVGNEKQKSIARKVKYLFVVGDNIDGVGVYPGQEELLEIKSIGEQYSKLASLIRKIRKDITIVMCPGQHDCVRVAEPQPKITKVYASELYEISNLLLVSNPAIINIASSRNFPGFNVLMYHGASFHNLINEIESLRLGDAADYPTKVSKEILKMRHLAPSHSSTTYIPFGEDSQLIADDVDIMVTGEMHKADVSSYNNVLLIQSSCWQSQTPFEEKVGNNTDPCKVPVLNLKTRQVNIMDFS